MALHRPPLPTAAPSPGNTRRFLCPTFPTFFDLFLMIFRFWQHFFCSRLYSVYNMRILTACQTKLQKNF